jgi:hypothetical protein
MEARLHEAAPKQEPGRALGELRAAPLALRQGRRCSAERSDERVEPFGEQPGPQDAR